MDILAAEIDRLRAADPPTDPWQIVHLYKLMIRFNWLLFEIGRAEIQSASQPAEMTEANGGVQPFPCGIPIPPPSATPVNAGHTPSPGQAKS